MPKTCSEAILEKDVCAVLTPLVCAAPRHPCPSPWAWLPCPKYWKPRCRACAWENASAMGLWGVLTREWIASQALKAAFHCFWDSPAAWHCVGALAVHFRQTRHGKITAGICVHSPTGILYSRTSTKGTVEGALSTFFLSQEKKSSGNHCGKSAEHAELSIFSGGVLHGYFSRRVVCLLGKPICPAHSVAEQASWFTSGSWIGAWQRSS